MYDMCHLLSYMVLKVSGTTYNLMILTAISHLTIIISYNLV